MAQLDSASDSDSDGWRFKSAWVRHLRPLQTQRSFYCYQTDSVPVADAIDTLLFTLVLKYNIIIKEYTQISQYKQ